jgi:hypothetical protein
VVKNVFVEIVSAVGKTRPVPFLQPANYQPIVNKTRWLFFQFMDKISKIWTYACDGNVRQRLRLKVQPGIAPHCR